MLFHFFAWIILYQRRGFWSILRWNIAQKHGENFMYRRNVTNVLGIKNIHQIIFSFFIVYFHSSNGFTFLQYRIIYKKLFARLITPLHGISLVTRLNDRCLTTADSSLRGGRTRGNCSWWIAPPIISLRFCLLSSSRTPPRIHLIPSIEFVRSRDVFLAERVKEFREFEERVETICNYGKRMIESSRDFDRIS